MLGFIKRISRPDERYLVFAQVVCLGVTCWALFQSFSIGWWMLGFFGYSLIFGLGITVTFHRLMAHQSYVLWKPLEYLFALFANLGCTGSSVGWIFVHRTHHRYSDKVGDPHSPVVLGRVGAMIGQYGQGFDKWMVRDIIADPVHLFYHNYYHLLITALPVALWLVDVKFAIFLFAVPVCLNTLASRLSNWIDHEPRFGSRSAESGDSSHNVWWWSLLTFGEGWHNNHHSQPWNYEFGRKWYQIDFGKWVIQVLHAVGLVQYRTSRE